MSSAEDSRSKPITYAGAGVDIDAGNALVSAIKPLAKATSRPGADVDLGGFGGLFDLKRAGFRDPILVAANDGVGTKLKIAIDTGRHSTIGIDLVAMCVNDLVVQGAEPLFFLDYLAVGKLDVGAARDVIAGIAEGCKQAGSALIGGETAEMPGMYKTGDYDLAGFAVGAVERNEVLPRPDIAIGDTLIGLMSSGVHSNGYSLVRKLVSHAGLDWSAPALFRFWQNGRRSTADADADLRQTRSRCDPRDRRIGTEWSHKGAVAHYRRRPFGKSAARHAEGRGGADRPFVVQGACRVRLAREDRQPR